MYSYITEVKYNLYKELTLNFRCSTNICAQLFEIFNCTDIMLINCVMALNINYDS